MPPHDKASQGYKFGKVISWNTTVLNSWKLNQIVLEKILTTFILFIFIFLVWTTGEISYFLKRSIRSPDIILTLVTKVI